MNGRDTPLDLFFLGSGNAFGAEGRAFSSFVVNGRYLFDAGPTLLQQLRRGGMSSDQIDVVFISHFHADHFFGLPFLFLDAWREGRTRELCVVGPPGVEEHSESLLETGFPLLPAKMTGLKRRYIEVADGAEGDAAGLSFAAAEVEHVPGLRCFAYQARLDGRVLTYSGDTKLCDGLYRLVPDADTLVVECSCHGDPVHMSITDLAEIKDRAMPGAKLLVTHLDGIDESKAKNGLVFASDLTRFRL